MPGKQARRRQSLLSVGSSVSAVKAPATLEVVLADVGVGV